MEILDFEIGIIKSDLKKPFVTNLRRVETIEDICLKLFTDDGLVGFGEAPPTLAITGESLESIRDTIGLKIIPAIRGIDISNEDEVFGALNESIDKNSSAKACVDMAIYDIIAKKASKPLCEYLGGVRKRIKTNLTISLNSPAQMVKDSIEACSDGFEMLKIKLGPDELQSIQTIKLIREILPNATIRVDANQAWSEDGSLRIIEKIAHLNIELIEQPVAAHDLAALKNITARSAIPILADESVFSLEDAKRIVNERMADYINIKLMKSGGIYNAKKIVGVAKEHGVKIMMGSMLESVVSISAGVHFAMSDESICFYDLDGALLAKPSDIPNALVFDKDEISIDECVGLGISDIPQSLLAPA